MKYKVFIDGAHGTTGLEIRDKLAERKDIEVTGLPEEERKDLGARIEAAKASDLTILCLPDEASSEIASKLPDEVRVIDTSTSHRVSGGWTYGFPEIGLRDEIRGSSRVANPGCHATGFISLAKPLVDAGVVDKDQVLSVFSLTGYSGGGKKMIEEYDLYHGAGSVVSPMEYALTQEHKHLPEMKEYSGLSKEPLFSPIVGDYYRGMEVTLPLPGMAVSPEELTGIYRKAYEGEKVIKVAGPEEIKAGRLYADELADTDSLEILVTGNPERVLVTALFDNLGKGASGAAVQNMNIMLGIEETEGLTLYG